MENVIAIDGPSGSGKSTVAKKVASKLNALYIDTGAMFRSIAYVCNKNSVNLEQEKLSSQALELLKVNKFFYAVDANTLIEAYGENLTEKIRDHLISDLASKVSRYPEVRDFVANWQRKIVENHLCVLEGRDIGTVIFPMARLKIFLTAKPEVRAKRRYQELEDRGTLPEGMTLEQLRKDIEQRDLQDSTRELAPLKKADDAIEIDTSDLAIDQVVDKIVDAFS